MDKLTGSYGGTILCQDNAQSTTARAQSCEVVGRHTVKSSVDWLKSEKVWMSIDIADTLDLQVCNSPVSSLIYG